MDACIVGYPKDFCDCSESCKFVSNYFVQGDHNDDQELDKTEVLSMKKFSRLITPIPGMDDELDLLESREGGKQVMNFAKSTQNLFETLPKSRKCTTILRTYLFFFFFQSMQFLTPDMAKTSNAIQIKSPSSPTSSRRSSITATSKKSSSTKRNSIRRNSKSNIDKKQKINTKGTPSKPLNSNVNTSSKDKTIEVVNQQDTNNSDLIIMEQQLRAEDNMELHEKIEVLA